MLSKTYGPSLRLSTYFQATMDSTEMSTARPAYKIAQYMQWCIVEAGTRGNADPPLFPEEMRSAYFFITP